MPLPRALRVVVTALLLLATAGARVAPVRAQGAAPDERDRPTSTSAESAATPRPSLPALRGAPDLTQYLQKPILRVELAAHGERWNRQTPKIRAEPGQLLSPELVRRSLNELLDSGLYADVRAEVEAEDGGVVLRFRVTPRRIVSELRVGGSAFDDEALRRDLGIGAGKEIVFDDLERVRQGYRAEHARRGYPQATVEVTAADAPEPLRVVLHVAIAPGPVERVGARKFFAEPDPRDPVLTSQLATYAVDAGDPADEEALAAADRELESRLRQRGFYSATVGHRVLRAPARATALHVEIHAGVRTRIDFEGNRLFDRDELLAMLELDEAEDRSPEALSEKIRRNYVERGYFDVEVEGALRPAPGASIVDLVLVVREGQPLRIKTRQYPCLTGYTASQVGSEIDSFLAELPGGGLFGPVDDRALAPQGSGPSGLRHKPRDFTPWTHYVPEVYERATEHLRDLYHSEGYLSASVGPVQVVRRSCDRRSPYGTCLYPPAPRVPHSCAYDPIGLPLEEPPAPGELCVPDPAKGRRCDTEATLYLPIKLGPRTYLYDVAFEGNRALVEERLFRASELELGTPLSQAELDRARRRILDAYAEEGFAFAEVEVELDLSPDHTRGRARFVVSERMQVRVSRIVVRGANLTSMRLVQARIALEQGGIYRRSLVRRTEERLATLGVFGSVNIGFEDPYVPAREKVVVITLEERLPQYLDIRPGVSSGEGFRISFEYGHRNLLGEAIQFTVRSQLNFLPLEFILEDDVRAKHGPLERRIGRHNSASIEFPDIGLGPLFRLNLEGIDVRDNARDYGLTKDAGIVTLIFRPERRFSAQLGGSLELNQAEIFGDEGKGALEDYIEQNPGQLNTFRVPEGTTFVIAQRIGATWDQRDAPLDATRGFLLSGSVEHVHAKPVGDDASEPASDTPSPFTATTSDFISYTSRVAGYLRLSKRGLALAASFRWGLIRPTDPGSVSPTYPDRLFFMGGVDSIRGFFQDSLVPEDIADKLRDPDSGLRISQVVIRGGNAFVNPRLELRIPVSEAISTALFLDSGNLWTDPELVNPLELRYAVGTGIRIATPVGPLVFDYGFNVDRVLDRLEPTRSRQRYWEDLGAFHFSIGLF